MRSIQKRGVEIVVNIRLFCVFIFVDGRELCVVSLARSFFFQINQRESATLALLLLFLLRL